MQAPELCSWRTSRWPDASREISQVRWWELGVPYAYVRTSAYLVVRFATYVRTRPSAYCYAYVLFRGGWCQKFIS